MLCLVWEAKFGEKNTHCFENSASSMTDEEFPEMKEELRGHREIMLPASAQQICPKEESYVNAFGNPIPSDTTTLRFWPSTDELSILGASLFQSDQYRVLQGDTQDSRDAGDHFTVHHVCSSTCFGAKCLDLANTMRQEGNHTHNGPWGFKSTGLRGPSVSCWWGHGQVSLSNKQPLTSAFCHIWTHVTSYFQSWCFGDDWYIFIVSNF